MLSHADLLDARLGMKDAAELLGHREALKCRLGGGVPDQGHPGDMAPGSDSVEGTTLLPGEEIATVGSNSAGMQVNGKEQEKQQQPPPQSSGQTSSQQKQKRHRTRFTPAQLNELERQLRQNALPRHLHEGGAGASHRPHRVQSSVLRRGRHGEQPVLLSRQRLPLGHRDAGGVPAAAPAGPRPSARHAAVAVTVQSGSGPATKLHGTLQRPVLQRFGPAVPPLPITFPRNVGLSLRPHERIWLPAAV
ncbi:unnamed protein product [Tetraodon nigroviridis]|uniref:(spotted green pufferfish) hypothetical protein n=1 Tax=Tetraodon nigroviridis TaxID=99883 RepID=Q4RUW6_TETNG|nr:unnamed protein product [Tetraodon nigroviridis]